MSVWRDGKLLTAAVTLADKPGGGAAPEARPPRPAARKDKDQEPFGFSVDEQPGEMGLRIAALDLRGSAYRAGLREGDRVLEVDGRPVRDRGGFRKAISESRAAVTRLFVKRGNRSIFFGLRKDAAQTAQVQPR